jgi:hypothetical protein
MGVPGAGEGAGGEAVPGRKINILYFKKLYFILLTCFEILSQIKEKSINYCDYFIVNNFCQGRPLLLLVLGAKVLSYIPEHKHTRILPLDPLSRPKKNNYR